MRSNIVIANWKMNGDRVLAERYIDVFSRLKTNANVIVIPPIPLLPLLADFTYDLGVQNFYPADYGPYTGEISLSMLSNQIRYALVGHSERRQLFLESDNLLRDKFEYAKKCGMVPVFCIGESSDARQSGQTAAMLKQQLKTIAAIGDKAFDNCIIAYEPVWAIGTGCAATPDEAQQSHQLIRSIIASYSNTASEKVSILYGGSVNPINASSLIQQPDIDGMLVGGASLDVDQFVEIVKCIS